METKEDQGSLRMKDREVVKTKQGRTSFCMKAREVMEAEENWS